MSYIELPDSAKLPAPKGVRSVQEVAWRSKGDVHGNRRREVWNSKGRKRWVSRNSGGDEHGDARRGQRSGGR